MSSESSLPLYRSHSRSFETNKFVYPVLSRRSKGISIGINLNPDKICNFDCIYCQVDRRSEAETRFVELDQLTSEIDDMLALVTSGEIYQTDSFRTVPAELRRLNDLAFSGDGEPTTYKNFDRIVQSVAEIKTRRQLDDVKMVLISNATMFHRPNVQKALSILDKNNGEIWAKLETGTEEYYRLIERTTIPFQQVLDNIADAARRRPLVIQSLFMRVHEEPPSTEEIEAYCNRLSDIVSSGGQIKLVQVYTVARQPAESFVAPLPDSAVDAIAERIKQRTDLSAEVYYSGT